MIVSVGGSDHPAAQAVHDEATLRAVLADPAAEHPVAYQLQLLPVTRGQRSLLVGLHADRGVLWWNDPAHSESLIAVGGDNHDDVVYYIGPADFELPPGAEHPRAVVLAAAVEFMVTGQRPSRIRHWVDEHEAFAQREDPH